jgi:YD repeat-containing protein
MKMKIMHRLISGCSHKIKGRQGRGDKAYSTYVEQAGNAAHAISQRMQPGIKSSLILFIISALLLIYAIPSFAASLKYTYDDLNRLTKVEHTDTGYIEEYTYDEVGNRTLKNAHYSSYVVTPSAVENGTTCPTSGQFDLLDKLQDVVDQNIIKPRG